VALFWTKVGSPTPTAASGTIEEIREFVQRKGPGRAMVYFCRRPLAQSPDDIDTTALDALKNFKDEMKSRGLYKEFQDTAEFERDLYADLDKKIRDLRRGHLPIPGAEPYQERIWWDEQAADPRLRAPIDFGTSLDEIASKFSSRMDVFDKKENNTKFLKLGEHVYLSVARAIEMHLHSRPHEIDFRVQPRLTEICTDLRKLSDNLDQYLRSFAKYWERGRAISNRLIELAKENQQFSKTRSF